MKPTESMIEAAARSLAWPNPPADELAWEMLPGADQTMFLMDAEAALIAAMPLIEAAVAERIADRIESSVEGMEQVAFVACLNYHQAARFARTYPEWSAE